MAIAQNFSVTSPSLSLDFAAVQALDPRITFSRASTATYYGTRTAVAEQNLLKFSEQLDDAIWIKQAGSITANTSVAPDGTTTAETFTGNGVSSNHTVLQASVYGALTVEYAFSVYAKAGTNNFIQLDGSFDTVDFANFDLSAGTIGTVGAGATATITSIGSGWYRCSIKYTPTAGGYPGVNLVTSSTAARSETNTLTTSVLLWGAQLEQRSAPTAYTVTTTQPITNYIPVLETAASGVARFDHNPTTFESLGLLVEQQSTNLLLYSEQFDNAAWTKTNATITANTIIAPDGTLTGDRLVETTASAIHRVFEGVTATAIAYTFSFYAKAGGRNFVYAGFTPGSTTYAYFDLANGTVGSVDVLYTSASISAVGNGWYRCSVTTTATAATWYAEVGSASANGTFSYTGDGYSGVFIWGAQLEALAFPTSYIPTVASQVTRAADSASMTGTNFSSWYNQAEGSFYTEAATNATGDAKAVSATDGTASGQNNSITLDSTGTKTRFIVQANAISQAGFVSTANYTRGTFVKIAGAYAVNNFGGTTNAEAITTDTSGLVPPIVSLEIGFHRIGSPIQWWNGTIKKIAYYPLRLTNTQLQSITG